MRLDIPAGTAIRFEPGGQRRVPLTEIGGTQIIRGGNGMCDGPVEKENVHRVLRKLKKHGFRHLAQAEEYAVKAATMPRELYAASSGPTVGDKIRLGDIGLLIEVEKDLGAYADGCMFGSGKVIRDGMGQAVGVVGVKKKDEPSTLDTVIINALVFDAVTGIVKCDIGIKDGYIVGLGKAGNPDAMEGVSEHLIVGCGTEVISAGGQIVTAGALDCHVHFICPQLIKEAIAAGSTTMIGGGTGPASGTCATTCTPGPQHLRFL
ncbi:hypothetical protein RvY_05983 [Ramazzottius varieornatus]|uniref:urease n=1 Tax=Ramazzottius varieornatus TaxID=947166 RepID=A0A1D1V6L6_RAMVA|nr:hypothetical protein RvY_05983 [Ramazzottius varieornatus]